MYDYRKWTSEKQVAAWVVLRVCVLARSTGFSRNPRAFQPPFRLKAVLRTDAPFNRFGGIGRAYELFGDRLAEIMEEFK